MFILIKCSVYVEINQYQFNHLVLQSFLTGLLIRPRISKWNSYLHLKNYHQYCQSGDFQIYPVITQIRRISKQQGGEHKSIYHNETKNTIQTQNEVDCQRNRRTRTSSHQSNLNVIGNQNRRQPHHDIKTTHHLHHRPTPRKYVILFLLL